MYKAAQTAKGENAMEKKAIATLMNEKMGADCVKEENVVEVPSDGCEGHMGSGPWKVYAARAGEFTILVYDFKDGQTTVTVV